MKIEWYGHASFLITANDGRSVITDPYTPETSGYQYIEDEPDIVITSSINDSFHDRADLIPGKPIVINALDIARASGEQTEKGITFKAIESMEMINHPEHAPDKCAMYRFEVDGISIGHMGDVGNPFTPEEIEFFRDLDVFLVLAGGIPTIELGDLKDAIDAIQPKMVIPMHFRTLRYKPRNMSWITEFLPYFQEEQIDFASNWEIELQQGDLPSSTRIMVLTHSR